MKRANLIFAASTLFIGMACLTANGQGGSSSEASTPYQALVGSELAEVFSGPGDSHYATTRLQQGTTVDVYRHDPGGWCAIRPPSGSFSLVPAAVIDRASDQVGIVTEEGVQAWVGTRLGSVENPLWQVKLKLNEKVAILGETSWPNPEGHSTIWYQIEPPAGEFRWIRESEIQPPSQRQKNDPKDERIRVADNIASTTDGPQDRPTVVGSSYQQSDPMFDEDESGVRLDPPSLREGTINRGWRKATRSIRVADNRQVLPHVEPFKVPAVDDHRSTFEALARESDSLDSLPAADLDSSRSPTSPASNSDVALAKSIPIVPLSGQVTERIRRLESELTRQLLSPPAQWQLEPILREATSISTSSNILQERQHAQRLVGKIRRCTTIQSGFESAYTTDTDRTAVTGSAIGTGVDDQVELGTTYDAHGWLNQLVRDKGRTSSTYVLENDRGEILFHVAATPGLNLNRYLNQKVGLIGRRGFHNGLKLDHVTAERVVVLDKIRR